MNGATALLFDLDGTLIDSREDIAASANFLRARAGRGPLSQELVGSYIGDGIEALVARVLEAPQGQDLSAEADAFRRHYHEHCVVKTRLYPGVEATLRALRQRGYAMAVVTNKPERISRRILELLKVEDCFPAVLGGNSTPFKKPRPEPLWAACEALGSPRGRAWMVGDSRIDVEAASNAGLPCAAILGGIGDQEALKSASPALLLDNFPALLTHFGGKRP